MCVHCNKIKFRLKDSKPIKLLWVIIFLVYLCFMRDLMYDGITCIECSAFVGRRMDGHSVLTCSCIMKKDCTGIDRNGEGGAFWFLDQKFYDFLQVFNSEVLLNERTKKIISIFSRQLQQKFVCHAECFYQLNFSHSDESQICICLNSSVTFELEKCNRMRRAHVHINITWYIALQFWQLF